MRPPDVSPLIEAIVLCSKTELSISRDPGRDQSSSRLIAIEVYRSDYRQAGDSYPVIISTVVEPMIL